MRRVSMSENRAGSGCPFCGVRSDTLEALGEHVRSEHVVRLPNNPIVDVESADDLGGNVNGPSIVGVPDWIEAPLGEYYLYFAHHSGEYIRLAYADQLDGSWEIHGPGTLRLEESRFDHHIASPDVHVDHESERMRMYYHGRYDYGSTHSMLVRNAGAILRRSAYVNARRTFDRLRGAGVDSGRWRPTVPSGVIQHTRVAVSPDGLDFSVDPGHCGMPYFRVFEHDGTRYALSMPGVLYRSSGGFREFEPGPVLFPASMRHAAVQVVGDTLRVFYSRAGDRPERILLSQVALRPDWNRWTASDPVTVLEPERTYEGGDRPLRPSSRGASRDRVRQVRDPAVFVEDGTTYLLYSVAGERGLAIAKIVE
ncbi:MAG: hypothetical protein V5A62_19105 [Haloarculaceae archaeon]